MSDSDVLNHIYKEYGKNEPIFTKDLTMIGISPIYIRQSLTHLTEQREIMKYSQGIYFIQKIYVQRKIPTQLQQDHIEKIHFLEKERLRILHSNILKEFPGLTEESPSVI